MKKQDRELDTLCSQYIRMRAIKRVGGCERCLTPKYGKTREDGSTFPAWKTLQWAHFITRSNHKVRWDPDNSAGTCGGCHFYLDSHPYEKIEFFTKRLGETGVDLLRHRARQIKPDKQLIAVYLKQKIRELENGN